MKKRWKPILCLLLAMLLFCLLTACSTTVDITIDEQGVATWTPVKGATEYEYAIVNGAGINRECGLIAHTSVHVPEGFCVQVRPVFKGGKTGDWSVSDFFGEPINDLMAITIDERGYASWEPVEGAVEYRYEIVNIYASANISGTTMDTMVRLPRDHCIQVRPVYENGEIGPASLSAYFGKGLVDNLEEVNEYVEFGFSVKWSDLKSYNLIENIDFGSVKTMNDGSVTFTATAPNGGDMRFVGTNAAVEDGVIKLDPGGEILALDSIGRICAYKPVVSDPGSESNCIELFGGYTFNGENSVERLDDLFRAWKVGVTAFAVTDGGYPGSSMMQKQPNMIGFGSDDINGVDTITFSEMIVYYDETTYATALKELHLEPQYYGTYIVGDRYDPSREVYDPEQAIFDFYLLLMPDLQDEINPSTESILVDSLSFLNRAVMDILPERYTIGDLKDGNGKILNKATDPLTLGSTLDITIAGVKREIQLPVLDRYAGAQTLHEMTPHANTPSEGNITTLVIPVQWPDCPEEATEERLEILREKLGRVVDANGNVTDYSGDGADGFSLSQYYDTVSYGEYHIESFITDWVTAPYDYAQKQYIEPANDDMPDMLFEMVRKMYPDMDWSRFDINADGLLDSVILFSAGTVEDSVNIPSYGGAVHSRRGYGAERAGLPERPNLKDFVTISSATLQWDNVILHEYAHNFGIIDYYDVSYSGIDAVGHFDMQSSNIGDWNAYSKFSVGWVEPEVVSGLASGESVEYTIGAMVDTGDAIVIPGADATFDGPFGEYILVDLFTDGGVNAYDAAEFGIGGATGVRIYHVNATMERRDVTDIYGDVASIGTVNLANQYKESGKYHIELLQAGGENTFTDIGNLRSNVIPEDFFQAGDVFDAADYSQFLVDGRMDDGSEFGYTIEVVSVDDTEGSETATIRITRN